MTTESETLVKIDAKQQVSQRSSRCTNKYKVQQKIKDWGDYGLFKVQVFAANSNLKISFTLETVLGSRSKSRIGFMKNFTKTTL